MTKMNVGNTRLKEFHHRPVAALQVELSKTRQELREVKARLARFEESQPRSMSDERAKPLIEAYIEKRKVEGMTELGTLDFMVDLKLPPEQVIRIMESLLAKGVRKND